ncbi:MAG: Lrp/AsnC ligand binding domain-containing protein [Candidatus Eremiobacteraeota bacterium]|nr:Lrp/AsnC ligand binding domain-containing protein [Candidatus Eremiobacteraeota bacterium]
MSREFMHLGERKVEAARRNATVTLTQKNPGTPSGYACIRIKEDAEFLPLFGKLSADERVAECETTRGDYDLILLIKGKTDEELGKETAALRSMKGIGTMVFSQVSSRALREQGNREACPYGAYAFAEVEPGRLDAVSRRVSALESVAACATLEGPYQLALIVEGPSYGRIDEMVRGAIAPLEGVLRVHQCPVI